MNTSNLEAFGLTPIGHLATRNTRDTPGSLFSVGCECLDRDMWNLDAVLPHLAELGAKRARVQTGWARCERVKGVIDFTWLDGIVDKFIAAGLEPWLCVCYGNRLYIPEANHEAAIGIAPLYNDEAREAWTRFCAAVAEHYRGRVKFFEIWNEPDHTHWWGPPKPSGADYARFLRLSSRAIRAANPDAKVVGGAVAMLLDQSGMSFMETALRAGAADDMDVLSYHVYRRTIERSYERQVQAFRALVARHAPHLPVWQGESGTPSDVQTEQALADLPWTPLHQAKWLCRRTVLDLALNVDLVSWFHASDFDHYISQGKVSQIPFFYGVVSSKPDYKRKVSFTALQTFCSLFSGGSKPLPNLNALLEPMPTSVPPPARVPGVAPAVAPLPPLKLFAFEAEGRHVLAYWNAADTFAEVPATAMNLHLWDADDAFGKPVLIDPLTQRVYRPEKVRRVDGFTVVIEGVPVVDWPLLVSSEERIALR